MQTVKHKLFGKGEVISKDIKESGATIVVKFESGKESIFTIPDSFLLGIMDAEGTLKDEVDKAILEKKARKLAESEARAVARTVAPISPKKICRGGKKTAKRAGVKGALEKDFEEYLIKAGYKEKTASGNPSTVSCYVKGVETVLDEEKISWNTLEANISTIISKYDVGGEKEHIGAKSNSTVINALRRFEEFVKL